jgi:hypothetical protein
MAGPADSAISRFQGGKEQYRSTPDGDIATMKMDSAPGATKEVALFLPKGFDPSKPAIIMPYFHGHGGGINDTLTRQKLAEQAAKSGKNIAFVIPQLSETSGFDNKFKDPKNVEKFLNDSGEALAKLYVRNHPDADAAAVAQQFRDMPVVPLTYSGGYRATAATLTNDRVKGVVMLDSMYGELRAYTDFAKRADQPFVSVTYGPSTKDVTAEFDKTAPRGSKIVAPMKVGHGELVQNALGAQLDALVIPDNGKITIAGVGEKPAVVATRPQTPRG